MRRPSTSGCVAALTPRLAAETNGVLDGVGDSHSGGPGWCLSSMARGRRGGRAGGLEGRLRASLLRFTAVGKGQLPPPDSDAWQGRAGATAALPTRLHPGATRTANTPSRNHLTRLRDALCVSLNGENAPGARWQDLFGDI